MQSATRIGQRPTTSPGRRLEATQSTDNQRQKTAEPVYLESTLLRVFGVLFCHDPKRPRSRTGKIEINRGVAEKGVAVRFDPEYAQPGPSAHKVAMAVVRKQSSFGRPAQQLCVDSTCINQQQLAGLLALEAQQIQQGQVQISTPTPPVISGTTTPPSIDIQGNNPATINVGDTYTDLGAAVHDDHTRAVTNS